MSASDATRACAPCLRLCACRRPHALRCDLRALQADRGFTLLELLVVIAIIALLAAYVGPRYFAQVGKSEQGVAKAQIEAFAKALGTYRLDMGRYPSSEEGLAALMERPSGASAGGSKWSGPYLLKAVPLDPWGRSYVYRSPGAKGEDFELLSFGRDGQAGGEGDAADVEYR
jgi:general secretion pathway protein G